MTVTKRTLKRTDCTRARFEPKWPILARMWIFFENPLSTLFYVYQMLTCAKRSEKFNERKWQNFQKRTTKTRALISAEWRLSSTEVENSLYSNLNISRTVWPFWLIFSNKFGVDKGVPQRGTRNSLIINEFWNNSETRFFKN